MKDLRLLLIAAASFFAWQCSSTTDLVGSGNSITDERPLSSFDEIEVEGAFELVLKPAKKHQITVTCDDNLVKWVKTTIKEGTLQIALTPPPGYNGVKPTENIQLFCTAQELKKIQLNGAAIVTGSGKWSTEQLKIGAGGTSEITLEVEVNELVVSAHGSSNLNLSGSATHQEINASGSCSYQALSLASQTASLHIQGAGDIALNVEELLNVSLAGTGEVRYKGNPKVISQIQGTGDLIKL